MTPADQKNPVQAGARFRMHFGYETVVLRVETHGSATYVITPECWWTLECFCHWAILAPTFTRE